MSAPEDVSSSPLPSDSPQDHGLPALTPDTVEQDQSDLMEDIVPTRGYNALPIVGLGGSAGGLAALQMFFKAMPPDSGMAFVVIMHLASEHESILAELLQRTTSMPVRQVNERIKVETNCIYVIPPAKHLSMDDNHLILSEPARVRPGKHIAVDLFFRTLADAHGARGAAIVLSGADGDGAIGIKRIKERGGLTVAQDPAEAEHNSMPRSAIATGMVDWVLPVAEMPARLIDYWHNERQLRLPPEDGPQPASIARQAAEEEGEDETALYDILAFLRVRTGRDFTYYKRATILRRIARRMQVNAIAMMPDYLAFLRTHPGEAAALLQDMLISVTNFFRDRDAFTALEAVVPTLFRGKSTGDAVRVWCAACATGEEAYSVAMLLCEHANTLRYPPTIQVFASDLDENAIHFARIGAYPDTISADVSQERLQRFFARDMGGYRIKRELREMVLFAFHDLLKDSPFSRLDLVTCRNLFIYLNRDAQMRGLEIFHFTLRTEGMLFLGASESVEEGSPLFAVIDKKHRIYQRRAMTRLKLPPLSPGVGEPMHSSGSYYAATVASLGAMSPSGLSPSVSGVLLSQPPAPPQGRLSGWGELHARMLERFGPPSVVINAEYGILHLSGDVGRYLRFNSGEPTTNLLHVIHPALRIELHGALLRAAQNGQPVETRWLAVEIEGAPHTVDIQVTPTQDLVADCLLVVFREGGPAAASLRSSDPGQAAHQVEQELEQTKTQLRDTVEQSEASNEELKASNEELKASNEELQSMNEELRSASEELETGREELQSINEELSTVNQELKSKVEELDRSNSDLQNLMASTQIATVFLDRALCILRYTPPAVPLFNLIPTDVGRPLSDLTPQLNYTELAVDAARVLEHLVPVEREMKDSDEHNYLARLLPYRTEQDKIAGVVLTFVDITARKHAENALLKSEARLRLLVEASSNVEYEMSADWKQMRFLEGKQFLADTEDPRRTWLEKYIPPEDQSRVLAAIREAITHKRPFELEHRVFRSDGEVGWTFSRAVPLLDAQGEIVEWYGVASDVTERRRAVEEVQASEARFRVVANLVPDLLFSTDPAGNLLWCNDRWTNYTGQPLAQAQGKGWTEIIHPDDRVRSKQAFQESIAQGQPYSNEHRILAADGTPRWFLVRAEPLRDKTGKIIQWFGAKTEIEEFKRAADALALSEEKQRLIIESAREFAIFSTNLERHVTSWYSGAERLLGYTQEEIIGQSCEVIFTPEDRAAGAPEQEAGTALAEGKAMDERWHMKKDGVRFWGSGAMMRMNDAHGQAIGFVKILRDQTEAMQAREDLARSREDLWKAFQETEQARKEAEAAGRAKDHFLAVLSHELRTPLTPVLMAVHMLSRTKDLPESAREALEMIRRNIQLEAHFIDDLLDVTRITRGKLEILREPTDLHEAVRYAVEIAAGDIEAKAQTLTVALDAAECQLQGDATRLQQVFWNLLKNASKFTPEGGAIHVQSRNLPGRIVVEITDTGIGFEAEAVNRIFEAFAQANVDVTRLFGGLGLGLAISKATVDAHDGTIQAQSQGRDQGAVFTVELPLS